MLECGKFKFHILEVPGFKKKKKKTFLFFIGGCLNPRIQHCAYRELTVDTFTNYRKEQNNYFWVRERYGTNFTKETKESVGIISDVYFIVNKSKNINA